MKDRIPPGRRIRIARQDAGLTQAMLASKIGVHKTWVSQLENGTIQGFSDEKLGILCDLLQMDPDVTFAAFGRITPETQARIVKTPGLARSLREGKGE